MHTDPKFSLCVILSLLAASLSLSTAADLFLEAEQFSDAGGWDLDQQSMDQMGSPYLLAHGLGVPVRDAVTTANFTSPGEYHVWVRTRDWVAPWKAAGAPGRFQLLLNGKALPVTFGTEGADWHWQDGGNVQVTAKTTVALHDLTGFEGRCDAVLFCKDLSFRPPEDLPTLTKFRRAALGLPEEPEKGGSFDLVVVGGGIAGTSAAVSAARNGLTVALVQDRPVLGGNASSEVRVPPRGETKQKPYPHIGEIVDELFLAVGPKGNQAQRLHNADVRKLDVVHAEPRITLFTGQRVNAVEVRDGRIQSVVAQDVRTGRRVRLAGKLFADCTGDAGVGFLAGADYEVFKEGNMGSSNFWNPIDPSNPEQVLKCECKDKEALSLSVKEGKVESPFPRCPWAIDLTDKPFPGRKRIEDLGVWNWESGFNNDQVEDIERIRDLNFRAMYGAWDAIKNVDKLYPNHRIGWAAFIAGKRESRRLMGDVVLTADDFRSGHQFPDGAFPCTWYIDLHTSDPAFSKGLEGEEFIGIGHHEKDRYYKGPYWAPYRCLYSRNRGNLFMAGRDISVTREALGPVRVMRTCGMAGEIVGKAAWICARYGVSPRGVYEKHLPVLQELMSQPGTMRRNKLDGELRLPTGGQPDQALQAPAK